MSSTIFESDSVTSTYSAIKIIGRLSLQDYNQYGRFSTAIVEKKRRCPFEMIILAAFDAQLYFHVLVPLSLRVALKKLSVMKRSIDGTRTRMTFQLVHRLSDVLTKSCSLESCTL